MATDRKASKGIKKAPAHTGRISILYKANKRPLARYGGNNI